MAHCSVTLDTLWRTVKGGERKRTHFLTGGAAAQAGDGPLVVNKRRKQAASDTSSSSGEPGAVGAPATSQVGALPQIPS